MYEIGTFKSKKIELYSKKFSKPIFSGLALGIRALGNSGGETFVGILMIIVGVGFGLSAMADFYMLVKVSYFF